MHQSRWGGLWVVYLDRRLNIADMRPLRASPLFTNKRRDRETEQETTPSNGRHRAEAWPSHEVDLKAPAARRLARNKTNATTMINAIRNRGRAA